MSGEENRALELREDREDEKPRDSYPFRSSEFLLVDPFEGLVEIVFAAKTGGERGGIRVLTLTRAAVEALVTALSNIDWETS